MPRGPKKHMKRLNAPKAWMLGKMDGIWAPRPSQGPHKLRESLPLALILRNRLKYALTMQEVKSICMEKLVRVDGKIRTDVTYPAGFMDVVQLEKSGDIFRLLYDTKGRFVLHRINDDEATYKLCRVQNLQITKKKIPYITTHDGRTIRYPDPLIKVNDTVKVDIATNSVAEFYKFEIGNVCMIQRGRNAGRVGTVLHVEKHPGSFDIVHIKDAAGNTFATRLTNVFIIGTGTKPSVTLPKSLAGHGIKLTIHEERSIVKSKKKQN